MKVIFEMPVAYRIAYADITTQCGDLCDCEEKENLSGDQIIAIIAIAAPIIVTTPNKKAGIPGICHCISPYICRSYQCYLFVFSHSALILATFIIARSTDLSDTVIVVCSSS